MSINFSIKVMLFLWRCGLVDGLTMIQFLANAAMLATTKRQFWKYVDARQVSKPQNGPQLLRS